MQGFMDILPFEMIANILSFLSPNELGKAALVSSLWSDAANSNFVWDYLCDRLWASKVYVPEEFRNARNNGLSKQAYLGSIADAKREYIKPEELSEFVWNFRFKEAAGEHWLENDPWWKDQKPARVRFLADGRCSSLDGWPAALDDSTGRTVDRRWRFIASAAGRQGPRGSFVQINNFPPLVVARYHNWGFTLQSCWVFYTSWPMPPRGAVADLEDAALEITTDTMKQEAMRYNIGVEFNLHDHAQILDLLQLLAHIHQPHGFVNLPNLGDDEDDDEEEGGGYGANNEEDTQEDVQEETPEQDMDDELDQDMDETEVAMNTVD